MPAPFRFLDLPGELRNAVYDAYASELTIRLHRHGGLYPALSRTCRQIRAELNSKLHMKRLPYANLEARVVDFDFTSVRHYLTCLEAYGYNDSFHIRKLTIYLDIMTPAATYGPGRSAWCMFAQMALMWYHEAGFSRYTNLLCDRRVPIRTKILRGFYDVTYIVRFPLSRFFSEQQRAANRDWNENFSQQFVRPHGARSLMMNEQIERAITGARARAWVDRYWEACRKWNAYLANVRERRLWTARRLAEINKPGYLAEGLLDDDRSDGDEVCERKKKRVRFSEPLADYLQLSY